MSLAEISVVPVNPDRVYTKAQICDLLGIHNDTFDRLLDPPPRTRVSPGRRGFRARDFAKWLDDRGAQ